MKSGAVQFLGRLLYEFRDKIPVDMLNKTISMMALLCWERNRELIKSVFGFFKVCCLKLKP